MNQNFASPAVAGILQRPPKRYGSTVLKAMIHLEKLNGCSVNNLKKYLASHYGIDCQVLDATIKPIMKMAMDRNILKNLGDTGKVSECKKRRKSTKGAKKRKGKKSKGKKRKKSTAGKKGKKTTGRKRRRRISPKLSIKAGL